MTQIARSRLAGLCAASVAMLGVWMIVTNAVSQASKADMAAVVGKVAEIESAAPAGWIDFENLDRGDLMMRLYGGDGFELDIPVARGRDWPRFVDSLGLSRLGVEPGPYGRLTDEDIARIGREVARVLKEGR